MHVLSVAFPHFFKQSSHGDGGHQDGNAKCKFEPEYGNHSTEYVACMRKNREYSEKGSDAEVSVSSCGHVTNLNITFNFLHA